MERFVPAKMHGYLDFLTVGIFICGADLFRVKDSPASMLPSQVMGPAVAAYSMLTDYGSDNHFGSARIMSMKTHLIVDAAFGLSVGLSPWIFGSWRKGWNYWAPQALAMSSELFFALTTKLDPD